MVAKLKKPNQRTTKSTAKKKKNGNGTKGNRTEVALTPIQKQLNARINSINRNYTGQEARD